MICARYRRVLPAGAFVAVAVALTTVGRAQEDAVLEEEIPVSEGQEVGPATVVEVDMRASFAESIRAAESAKLGAIADAEATYGRRAAALESASESLTADGRRRIVEGPLREAQAALAESLVAADATFEEATAAAVARYGGPAQAVLSEALAAIDNARLEYEVYVAVVGAADAALNSERPGTSSAETAYEARTVASIDAARRAKVHGMDELEEVEDAILKGVVAAIAGIETELLSRVTAASAAGVFRAAVEEYAAPRQLALDAALEAIEEDYDSGLKSAENQFSRAIARVQALLPDFRESLARHGPAYRREIRTADSALQDMLVWYYRKDNKNRERKFGVARRDAVAAHKTAIGAALAKRRAAISRDVPGVESFLVEVEARLYDEPDWRIYGGPNLSTKSVVDANASYRRARERSDAEFGEAANEYMNSMRASSITTLRERREDIEAGRAAARSRVVARVIGYDSSQAGRLRALEATIPPALLAVARQRPAETAPETPSPTPESALLEAGENTRAPGTERRVT